MSIEQRPRVYVVDDHPIIRTGVAEIVQRCERFDFVGQADNPEQARRNLPSLNPNVLIQDILFHDDAKSGFDLAEWARQNLADLKIIVFSSYGSEGYVRKMISIGVEGYVTKDEPLTVIEKAIDAVSSGHVFYSSSLLRDFVLSTGQSNRERNIQLSAQEAEVLQLVAEGETNESIAHKLHLSPSRIRDLIQSSCSKLNASNRTSAVVKAAKLGYVNV